MRLNSDQAKATRMAVLEVVSSGLLSVRVFGSRLNDEAKGGDLDLLLEFSEPI